MTMLLWKTQTTLPTTVHVLSSDVTWGASDVEAVADLWAEDFHSDATFPDNCEPFYDFER